MRLPNPLAAAERLRGALTDPARRERTMLLVLAVYLVAWTLYGAIAKSSQGLHPDMTEQIAWSRDLAWGYKHPPLAAFVVRLWFSVLPLAEWSYYLLAMLMPTLALWIAWRLAADTLDGNKRVAGLALMMLVPFFNFQALKYNVNTVLMPLWAATTFFFLRSYRTRGALYAALAGIAAAVSMLGKYWSVFLLAGLALAALIDRRRLAYVRSAAPWITVAAGAVVVAPHLLWLLQNHFAPFAYVAAAHGERGFAGAAASVAGYLAGSAGYVAIPVIIVLAAARPNGAALADMIWPADDERRLAAASFWGPLLLPAIGALAGGAEITSLWSMPAWTLLPVLLLSPPQIKLREIDTQRLILFAAVLPLVMLIASPFIAVGVQRNGPPASAQAASLASEVERLWHEATPLPLRFVGGDADLAFGIVTYAVERPRALLDLPPPGASELARAGAVYVCFAEDAGCRDQAAAKSNAARRVETEITRNFFRIAGQPRRYTIFIVPPQ
ncbi:MAG TPA: glycosyltransferase family 39 protein [Pseudolabrys sp.]|nr:glycosyltransferase family 39 protein [Pseudolabrys sp.]